MLVKVSNPLCPMSTNGITVCRYYNYMPCHGIYRMLLEKEKRCIARPTSESYDETATVQLNA